MEVTMISTACVHANKFRNHKISEWLAVNKLSLNANKTKFMIFHTYQKVMTDSDIPQLEINNTVIERVTEFNILWIMINEFMNWGSHSGKLLIKSDAPWG